MPSNSEMYERGALDAGQDDLNTFYYQHYYYYRRGYDDARRKQRGGPLALMPAWMLPLLTLLALAGVAGFWLLSSRSQPEPPAPVPTLAGAFVRPTALPIAQPSPSPVVTVSPTELPALRVGMRAPVVNVGDSPLRARAKPGLEQSNRIVVRFPQGAEVTIAEGPKQANGLIWWRIKGDAGEGWSAERSADGLAFLEPIP